MPISISEAFSRAIARTRLVCFQPFAVGRWLVLGFAAWLATLGEGGLNFSFNYRYSFRAPGSARRGGSIDDLYKILHWAGDHLPLIIGLAILSLILMLVMMWVRAHGRFVLLDDVARHAQDNFIVEPWKQNRQLANRLFVFQVALRVLTFLAMGVCVGGGLLIALPDLRAGTLSWHGGVALAVGIPLYLGLVLVFGLVTMLTTIFVIPLMYLRRCGPLAGWGMVLRELLPGNKFSIFLYILLKFVLGLAEAIITVIGICMTCCLAYLPYLRGVVFLPLYVFNQAIDICFLEEFGPQYKILSDVIKPTGFPILPPRLERPG